MEALTMRRARAGALAGFAALALAGLAALALACGPWGPQGILAGGPFLGAADASFPADWSFSDAHPLVAIR